MLARFKQELEEKLGYPVEIEIITRVPKTDSEAVALKLLREYTEIVSNPVIRRRENTGTKWLAIEKEDGFSRTEGTVFIRED